MTSLGVTGITGENGWYGLYGTAPGLHGVPDLKPPVAGPRDRSGAVRSNTVVFVDCWKEENEGEVSAGWNWRNGSCLVEDAALLGDGVWMLKGKCDCCGLGDDGNVAPVI